MYKIKTEKRRIHRSYQQFSCNGEPFKHIETITTFAKEIIHRLCALDLEGGTSEAEMKLKLKVRKNSCDYGGLNYE